jgi:hypothetical protein
MNQKNYPKKAVAIRAYNPTQETVLTARAGDILHPLRRDAQWPGWVWCADERGVEAWVPERWLRYTGGKAVLIKDYSSSELALQVGQPLTVLAEESAWVLVALPGGDIGWAPADCIQAVQESEQANRGN